MWDALQERPLLFLTHSSRFVTADGPAMAYINGLVGHQGRNGCRLYCPLIRPSQAKWHSLLSLYYSSQMTTMSKAVVTLTLIHPVLHFGLSIITTRT